jgi:hypothetical protein
MSKERKKRKWWQWLLAYPTIITGVIGAVPQYTTFMLNVPWGTVSEAEEQKALWTKNFECSWQESAQAGKTTLTTSRDERVTLTLCRSGDALVAFQPAGSEPRFRWIGFDRFERGAQADGFSLAQAAAAEAPRVVAQADSVVICVTRDAKGQIVRRLRLRDGKCQEQVINPYTGAVVEVRLAACTKC